MERPVKIRKNGELRGTPEVRVVAANGAMLGVMPLAQALRLAMKEGLDLVEVNPNADPPVCKLLDFATYKQGEPRRAADARRDVDGNDSSVPSEQAIKWMPFECDGRAFEYAAVPTKNKTRPRGWPTHEAVRGPWVPMVMVIVRKLGEEEGPAALLFPDGTVISTKHAIETAKTFWEILTK